MTAKPYYKFDAADWAEVGREASAEAVARLHSKGIATHHLEDGKIVEELPGQRAPEIMGDHSKKKPKVA